jgi:hypothetical protein
MFSKVWMVFAENLLSISSLLFPAIDWVFLRRHSLSYIHNDSYHISQYNIARIAEVWLPEHCLLALPNQSSLFYILSRPSRICNYHTLQCSSLRSRVYIFSRVASALFVRCKPCRLTLFVALYINPVFIVR